MHISFLFSFLHNFWNNNLSHKITSFTNYSNKNLCCGNQNVYNESHTNVMMLSISDYQIKIAN